MIDFSSLMEILLTCAAIMVSIKIAFMLVMAFWPTDYNRNKWLLRYCDKTEKQRLEINGVGVIVANDADHYGCSVGVYVDAERCLYIYKTTLSKSCSVYNGEWAVIAPYVRKYLKDKERQDNEARLQRWKEENAEDRARAEELKRKLGEA